MMLNLKVRFKNKSFWITIIPLIILLIAQVGDVFGITLDLSDVQDKLLNVVSIIFVILGLIGVTNDPTTEGLSDSSQALLYEEPKKS